MMREAIDIVFIVGAAGAAVGILALVAAL